MSSTVYTGMVKWFNGSRGFGFVTNLEDNVDIFAHHSGITTTEDCWKTLNMGEYVQFTIRKDDKGQDQAVGITGIKGGPLQCETRALNDRNSGRTRGSGQGRWAGNRQGNQGNQGRRQVSHSPEEVHSAEGQVPEVDTSAEVVE